MPLPTSAAEANRLGSPTYMSDRPCKYGHGMERYAKSSGCVVCVKQAANAHYHSARGRAITGHLKPVPKGHPLPQTRKDALALGCDSYFTGKACKTGNHVDERHTLSGGCKACRSDSHSRRMPEGKWAPFYGRLIDLPGILQSECPQMNARLPTWAAAILEEVRSGKDPLTSEELVAAVRLIRSLRTAKVDPATLAAIVAAL